MLSAVLTQATFWLCGAIFVRLFTYQRGNARFRLIISIGAQLVMGCAGATMLYIGKGLLVLPAEAWPLVCMLVFFTWSVFRAGGNLAGVLRSEAWNGSERRTHDER